MRSPERPVRIAEWLESPSAGSFGIGRRPELPAAECSGCSLRRPRPAFVRKAGEVRIGKIGITMNRDRQDVGTIVEDVLLSVAVVIVDIEDGDLAVRTEIVRTDGGVAEIAESAERSPFGMMPGGRTSA